MSHSPSAAWYRMPAAARRDLERHERDTTSSVRLPSVASHLLRLAKLRSIHLIFSLARAHTMLHCTSGLKLAVTSGTRAAALTLPTFLCTATSLKLRRRRVNQPRGPRTSLVPGRAGLRNHRSPENPRPAEDFTSNNSSSNNMASRPVAGQRRRRLHHSQRLPGAAHDRQPATTSNGRCRRSGVSCRHGARRPLLHKRTAAQGRSGPGSTIA
ncbi:hypothetical protein C8T65DRAFT_26723 [Cerioporus squamosus]|nr:hypothetical protein C8T65DRAFT_26723 [Cerioporus squamosus]